MSATVEARTTQGAAVELTLPEAVDAVQRLAGPGPLSIDLRATLEAGGTLTVGGWRFTGTGQPAPRRHIGTPATCRHDARLARGAAFQLLCDIERLWDAS